MVSRTVKFKLCKLMNCSLFLKFDMRYQIRLSEIFGVVGDGRADGFPLRLIIAAVCGVGFAYFLAVLPYFLQLAPYRFILVRELDV